MLFNSLHFFIFAPIVIAVYFALPWRWQRWWLLITSLYFYAAFDPPFTLLLLFSVVVTYIFVYLMQRASRPGLRKTWLWSAIISNLALLYVFKFMDFTFDLWNHMLGLEACDPLYAASAGAVLPMGISFFTLQAIGYAVDVYRRDISGEGSVFHFGLFESFFPQLVAGPIMRARDLLYQFEESHRFRFDDFRFGIGLIVAGLFKKTMVADPIGVVIDPVFANPGAYSSGALWGAVYLHALQIYGDFAGYTDVAIGVARIMGFRIPENFRRPFFSLSMTELWGRWHISLSTWLRDYIYIPLGGNRVSVPRTYFNLFITMFVSGVWHGAGLNYILWGLMHASFVIVEKYLGGVAVVRNFFKERVPTLLKIAYSFTIFSFALFFFRARPLPEIGSAADAAFFMIDRALQFSGGLPLGIPAGVTLSVAILMLAEAAIERKQDLFDRVWKNDIAFWTISAAIFAYCALIYSSTASAPFVYFQF